MGRRKRREEAPLSLFSFQDIMACLTGVLILITLILSMQGLSDDPDPSPERGGASAAEASALREELATLRKSPSQEKGGTDLAQRDVDVLDERVAQLVRDEALTKAALERAQSALRDEEARIRDAEARAESLRRQQADARRSAAQAALRARIDLRPGAREQREPVFVEIFPDRLELGVLSPEAVPVRESVLRDAGGRIDQAGLGKFLAARPSVRHSISFVVHDGTVARFNELERWASQRGYRRGWGPWGEDGSIFDPPPGVGK